MKDTVELSRGDCIVDFGHEASEASSYFQTIINMGNRDMQELTNRAVDNALGVGFFGGAGSGGAVLSLLASLGLP